MPGPKRTTEWSNTRTTNPKAWHQISRRPQRFEEAHYPVFLVQYFHCYEQRDRRSLYVGIKTTGRWCDQDGHRFLVNNTNYHHPTVASSPATTADNPGGRGGASQGSGEPEEYNVQDKTCRHPFLTHPASRMRLIGWVRRDDCPGKIRRVCRGVTALPPTADGYGCCHGWTDAAIQKLRDDGMLRQPRSFDDTAVRLGPRAVDDGLF